MNTEINGTVATGGGSNGRGRRSRSIMATGLALGLVAGAGASLAAGWPFAAGATTQSVSTTHDAGGHGDSPMPREGEGSPRGEMQDVLQSLVDDGTLTQDQVETILEALVQARDEKFGGGPRGDRDGRDGPGMGGPGAEHRQRARHVLETAAKVLGLDVKELQSEMKSGKTLAAIAEAHGTSRQELIDALVTAGIAAATERLNESIPLLVDGELGPRRQS